MVDTITCATVHILGLISVSSVCSGKYCAILRLQNLINQSAFLFVAVLLQVGVEETAKCWKVFLTSSVF